MKTTKKLFSILLAMVMLFTLALPAFAAGYSITISNPNVGSIYTLYKVFDATVTEDKKITYQLQSGDTLAENEFFEQDTAGNVVLKKNQDGTYVATGTEDASGALTEAAIK